VRQICNQSGYGKTKIYNLINYWLSKSPETNHNLLSTFKHVTFDGTFLHRPNSIVVLMDANSNSIIDGKFGIRENSDNQLRSFFQPLKNMGFKPKSFTLDGNPNVIRVVKELWPQVLIQRCMVHIQRQGIMWCRRSPRRTDSKHLRNLFRRVTYIKTIAERNIFLSDVETWEQRFGCSIISKPERGRVFSDVKRARSMLLKAIPNMFHYLDDLSIPKSTNGLEGYFSRLKSNYRSHRGLKPEKRASYFKWFFILKSK